MKHELQRPLAPGEEELRKGALIGTCQRCRRTGVSANAECEPLMIRNVFRGAKKDKCTVCHNEADVLISLEADDPGCAAEVCASCLREALALAESPPSTVLGAVYTAREIREAEANAFDPSLAHGATIEIRGECVVSHMANTCCSRGTFGCNVEHKKPPLDPPRTG